MWERNFIVNFALMTLSLMLLTSVCNFIKPSGTSNVVLMYNCIFIFPLKIVDLQEYRLNQGVNYLFELATYFELYKIIVKI